MLPRISIIIPSYNQAEYLEETLCSVLDQDYSNIEVIVIDGGSTDGSLEIIKRYAPHLAYWVSEPDRGQTHAINKGLEKITGEVWSYLNSDDLLSPGCLHLIGEMFNDPEIWWIGGVSEIFDHSGTKGYVKPQTPDYKRDYITPWCRTHQYVFPCSNVCFMRREMIERCGPFDENYHYGMDIEYYIRVVFNTGIGPHLIPDVLGRWRWHPESKTLKQGIAYGFREDEVAMAIRYLPYLEDEEQKAIHTQIQEQKHWLVTRRAMYFKEQGQINRAWTELLTKVVDHPRLLNFRPWYGVVKAILLAQ
jgi:glycosyltransferase involved in cell wall biosynthesis